MIYSPNNNEPLVLTEEAADSFLESVGVKLYDDEISINGTLYEGSYGESILEADGIFLYEDGIVLEGEAAKKVTMQDYTTRKAKKKEEDAKKYDYKYGRLYKVSQGEEYDKAHATYQADTNKRYDRFHKSVDAFIDNKDPSKHDKLYKQADMDRSNYFNHSSTSIPDIMRHNRKQAKKYAKHKNESTIFSDIEII